MTARDKWIEKEKILEGMQDYVANKQHKQQHSRGFLAGVKFYKEQILNK